MKKVKILTMGGLEWIEVSLAFPLDEEAFLFLEFI